MILKFYARDGLVREPGRRPVIGQAVSYLGREFVPPRTNADGSIVDAAYPATQAGIEWNTATHEPAATEHLLKMARKGAFWPADKATAEAVGVPLIDVEFKDGVWLPKPAAKAASSSKKEG